MHKILPIIAAYTRYKDISSLLQTNKENNKILESDFIWQTKFVKDFSKQITSFKYPPTNWKLVYKLLFLEVNLRRRKFLKSFGYICSYFEYDDFPQLWDALVDENPEVYEDFTSKLLHFIDIFPYTGHEYYLMNADQYVIKQANIDEDIQQKINNFKTMTQEEMKNWK